MSDDNLSLDSEDPNPEPYDPDFENESYEQTFEEILRSLYQVEKMSFSQVKEQLLNTINQVKDPYHLEQMMTDCINEYISAVMEQSKKEINQISRLPERQIEEKQCGVAERMYHAQVCLEDISREFDQVVQLYQEMNPHQQAMYVDFNSQEHHVKQFQDSIFKDQTIKNFLDQVTDSESYENDPNDPNNFIMQKYSKLHKKRKNTSQQPQLPDPSKAAGAQRQKQPPAPTPAKSHQKAPPDFQAINNFDEPEKKKKKPKKYISDEVKAKNKDQNKDEIKEFERRLDATHQDLKEDQKVKLSFSQEFYKKIQHRRNN